MPDIDDLFWFPICLRNPNAVVVLTTYASTIFDVNKVSKQQNISEFFFQKKNRKHCLKAFGSFQSKGVCKTRELLLLYCLVWFHNLTHKKAPSSLLVHDFALHEFS